MSDRPDPHTTVHPPAGTHHVHEGAPMHDPVDAWHDHSHDEQPQHAHAEVQNSRLVMGVGVALAAVIAISVLVVYAFYTHYNTIRSDLRERHMTDAVSGPAEVTRKEKDDDLTGIQNGFTFEIDTTTEGVKKTVTMAPIDATKEKVAQAYVQKMKGSSGK
jgi:hypothetical protein